MCKRVFMAVLAILLAGLVCSTFAWAQDQGQVQGGALPGLGGDQGGSGGPDGPGGPGGFGGPGGPGGHGGGRGGPGAGGAIMASPAMAIMPPSASMVRGLTQSLQLTDSQVQKLQEITANSDKSSRALMQKASEASRGLRSSVLAATYDAKKVSDLVARAQKAEGDMITANVATWTKIRSVLTEDQIAKLPKAIGQQGFGRGPGGPPPSDDNGTFRTAPPQSDGDQSPPPPSGDQ